MSDLREAILAVERREWARGTPTERTDAIMAVFEAYLREHDAQMRQDGYDAGCEYAEMVTVQRIRQRIEALPAGEWANGEPATELERGREEMREAVLEALGGSDER